MDSPLQRVKAFISSTNYSKTIGALLLLVIVAAVPITVFVAQQNQDVRQRAENYGNGTGTPTTGPTINPATKKLGFATSTQYDGNLGGLSGADAKCQATATAASLPGTWKAWLSDSTTDAKSRFVDGIFVAPDGSTVIANSLADLTDGSIAVALSKDEHGQSVTGDVWTGTKRDGTKSSNNCVNWTSNQNHDKGDNGDARQVNKNWTEAGNNHCNTQARLYCFQTDSGAATSPTPTASVTGTITPTPTVNTSPTPTNVPNATPTITGDSCASVNGRAPNCACTDLNQCSTLVCTNNLCQAPNPDTCNWANGRPSECACTSNAQCSTNNCQNSVCKPLANGHTQLYFSLILSAIGVPGRGNTAPQIPTRHFNVDLFDKNGTLISSLSAKDDSPITYVSTTGKFTASVDMADLASGEYIVKVKSPRYLTRIIGKATGGIQNIVGGQINIMPEATLVVGDVNGDNKLDALDFNILRDCGIGEATPLPIIDPASKFHSANCQAHTGQSIQSDLDNNGVIDGIDYNYFVISLATQEGD